MYMHTLLHCSNSLHHCFSLHCFHQVNWACSFYFYLGWNGHQYCQLWWDQRKSLFCFEFSCLLCTFRNRCYFVCRSKNFWNRREIKCLALIGIVFDQRNQDNINGWNETEKEEKLAYSRVDNNAFKARNIESPINKINITIRGDSFKVQRQTFDAWCPSMTK